MDQNELLNTVDATKWADEFVKVITEQPIILRDFIDRGLMITWFSSALTTGYNAGRRAEEELQNCLNKYAGVNPR